MTSRLLRIGLALLLGAPSAWLQAAPNAMELRTQAKSAFQSGDYDTATALYQQIASEQNQKLPVLREAMWSLWNMQKVHESAGVAHVILKLSPSDPEAKKILSWAPSAANKQRMRQLQDSAKAAYQRNDTAQAVADYREMVALDPNNPALLRDEMWILWNAKHIQEAMDVARKLRSINGDDRDAGEVLQKGGAALVSLKEKQNTGHKDPMQILLDRVAKNPEDAEAYRKLSWMYFNKGRYAAAGETLHRLLEMKPNDPATWYQLGKIQMETDNYQTAIESLRRSLDYNSNQPRVLAALGKCYAQLRDLDQAALYLNRAYELTPTQPDFLSTYAKVLFYRGEYRRSKEIWTQALDQEPNRIEYRFREAEAQYYAGQQTEALEKMQQLVLNNHDRRALGFLIDESISRKDYATAIPLLEQSTHDLSADDGRNVVRLARLYIVLKRPDDALALTQRWLTTFPNDLPVAMLKATALTLLNRRAEAVTVYRGVLDKNPNVIDADQELSEVQLALGDKDAAIDSAKHAFDLDPTNPYRLHIYARLLFEAERHEEARTILTDWLNQNKDKTVLPILLYHGLTAFEYAPMLAYEEHTTTVNFEKQMQALAWAGYHAVTLQQVLDWQAGRRDLPAKPVLIAFDDARRDSFEFADGVFARTGLKATMFVPADNVELSGALGYAPWWLINKYQKTGRWEIESHGSQAHSRIPTGPDQIPAMFLVMPEWLKKEQRVETKQEWLARIEADHAAILQTLKEKTGTDAIGYAYPEGLYGQQSNSRDAVALNVAAVKKYYKYAFVQDDYGMNLRSQDPYFMRRLEPKPEWTGPALLQHLSDQSPFMVVYKDLIYMSLYDQHIGEARQWLEQMRNDGASQQALLISQAKIEYAANNYPLAQQLAMQAFVADPTPENQNMLNEFKSRSGVVWRPGGLFQRDNQHRQNWNFEQQLEMPLGSHVHARLIQGVGDYQERGTDAVRDSVLGIGASLSWTDNQQVDADVRHHTLSGDANDLYGFEAHYRAAWTPWFKTQLEGRHELYGSARAVDAGVRENRARLQLHVGPEDDWGVTARARVSHLTDDNQRNTEQGEAGLLLFKTIGLGAVYQITFDHMRRVDDLYYSPQHLLMNELGPQLSIGTHTPLKLRLRYLPGIAKEDTTGQQFVQSAEATAIWNINKTNSLEPSMSYEETPTYNYFLSILTYQHEF